MNSNEEPIVSDPLRFEKRKAWERKVAILRARERLYSNQHTEGFPKTEKEILELLTDDTKE